jgi:hypothetical protein
VDIFYAVHFTPLGNNSQFFVILIPIPISFYLLSITKIEKHTHSHTPSCEKSAEKKLHARYTKKRMGETKSKCIEADRVYGKN